MLIYSYCCFFFFSSRRRHTRLVSDWSSDVCSSDLGVSAAGAGGRHATAEGCITPTTARSRESATVSTPKPKPRSEERRVGKECRYRGGTYHQKKKKDTTNRKRANHSA